MTMAKNYLKQMSLENAGFSSCVALRICFLTHLVHIPLFSPCLVIVKSQQVRGGGGGGGF
jgi:hypothetical protein